MAERGPDNIVLVGMRASGKTSVGQRLAERCGCPFVDLDDELAARAGRSADAVLADEGEDAFRAREREVLRWAASLRGHVVATGGGAVLADEAFAALAAVSRVAYLDVTAERLVDRCRARPRPPLTDAPLDEEVTRLHARRDPLYRAVAERVLPAGESTPDELAAALTDWCAAATPTGGAPS